MNIQLPAHMDKPSFLAWLQGREGRYELAGGRVVMMTGSTMWHGMVAGNVFEAFRNCLDRKRWVVLSEFGVDVGPRTLRYPDVVVDRPGAKGSDLTAKAPALVVEVLSPSTTRTDLGDKASEYLRLPGLLAYLVFAQDEVKAWVYIRDAKEFPAPSVAIGRDATINIPSLDIVLSLAEIYTGLDFDAGASTNC